MGGEGKRKRKEGSKKEFGPPQSSPQIDATDLVRYNSVDDNTSLSSFV